jgi:hypothetical protein
MRRYTDKHRINKYPQWKKNECSLKMQTNKLNTKRLYPVFNFAIYTRLEYKNYILAFIFSDVSER